jgi:hypothetical protein
VRALLTGLLLSTLLHVWIAHVTVWEVIGSKLQFLAWPGMAAAALLQNALPDSLTVAYDPMPHPAVMWAALVVNFVAWTALLWALAAAIGKRREKR